MSLQNQPTDVKGAAERFPGRRGSRSPNRCSLEVSVPMYGAMGPGRDLPGQPDSLSCVLVMESAHSPSLLCQ